MRLRTLIRKYNRLREALNALCVPQTLLEWVRRREVDAGVRPGVTRAEAQRVKKLEREVKELRRTNEILKLASAVFCPTGARTPTQV